MGPNDGVTAPEIAGYVGHVHGAAPPAGNSGGLAQQFSHHLAGRNSAIDRHTVIAVSRNNPVFRPPRRDQPGADGFLPNIEMQKTANFPLLIQFSSSLFQAPDHYHLMVQL